MRRARHRNGPASSASGLPKDLGQWRKTCRQATGEAFDAVRNQARDGNVSAARLIIEQAWGRVPVEEQVMTRAEYEAELERDTTAFVDSLGKVLDRFPGANEAATKELERREQKAAEGVKAGHPGR